MASLLRLPGGVAPSLVPIRKAPVEATSIAKLIGNLPGLTNWFDPDPAFLALDANGRLVWRDRVGKARFRTASGVTNSTNPSLTNAIGGKPTVTVVGTTLMVPDLPQAFNPAAWSLYVPMRADTSATRYLIGQAANVAGATDYGPNLALTAGGGGVVGTPRIYASAGGIRLSALNAVPSGNAALLGFHYSPSPAPGRGLTITLNGVVVANVADANNLNLSNFQLFQSRALTTSAWSGSVGDILVFAIDTTLAESATTHAAVTGYLLPKYTL